MENSATLYLKSDAFLIKADSAFNPVFMKNFGWFAANEQCTSVACDSSGNTYIAGNFLGVSIIFDNDTLFNAHNATKNIFMST